VLGLSFTNSDALVAPFGGVRPFVGTNPMSMAAESEDGELFCADMATSQVSYSRIKRAREAGGDLEPGWAVKADGRDAAGPAAAAGDPALKPLGGYKGQCLGMMVEILCAVLTGEPADHRLSHLYVPPYDRPRRVAHLFVALDVAAFTDAAEFRARLAALLAELRGQEAAGDEPVIAPGDLEAAAEADRGARGIPLNADELARFRELDAEAPPAQRLGL
jgi:LDH2 family malate/lactate/ureidoglycolate dehydrogenase